MAQARRLRLLEGVFENIVRRINDAARRAGGLRPLASDERRLEAQPVFLGLARVGARHDRRAEAAARRYPFGELADQVQLDLIYVYYKMRDSEKTAAQINRFMRLNPTSQYTDYVLYMTGLNQIQMRSDMLQDFIGLNRSQKDPTQYYEALKTFRNLIETYPESKYAADAHQRMIFIKQQLAEREMSIANYYYERGSYLSAIRHCQNILYSYRGTQYLKPALALMATCYEDLGLPEAAANVRSVQEASFGTLSATEEE